MSEVSLKHFYDTEIDTNRKTMCTFKLYNWHFSFYDFLFRTINALIKNRNHLHYSIIFINAFVLIHLIYLAIFNPKERMDLVLICGILLLNIPIVIGYIYLLSASLFPTKY